MRPHPPSSAPAVRPALSQSLQEEPTRRHAVLIAAAEGLLQDAVSAGAAGSSSSRSIGGALCELLMLPFVEVRVATFRFSSFQPFSAPACCRCACYLSQLSVKTACHGISMALRLPQFSNADLVSSGLHWWRQLHTDTILSP